MSREPVPVGCGSKGTRTVLLGDKVIRWVDASLAAPAAVVEQEALEVGVSHLSPKGPQKRKEEALAMEQTRWCRHYCFTHWRPPSFGIDSLPEQWRGGDNSDRFRDDGSQPLNREPPPRGFVKRRCHRPPVPSWRA